MAISSYINGEEMKVVNRWWMLWIMLQVVVQMISMCVRWYAVGLLVFSASTVDVYDFFRGRQLESVAVDGVLVCLWFLCLVLLTRGKHDVKGDLASVFVFALVRFSFSRIQNFLDYGVYLFLSCLSLIIMMGVKRYVGIRVRTYCEYRKRASDARKDWFRSKAKGVTVPFDHLVTVNDRDTGQWRAVANVFVANCVDLRGVSDESLAVVFSKNRTDRQTREYKSWKVLGDSIFGVSVLLSQPELSAGDMSVRKASFCSAAVFGAAVKARLWSHRVDVGECSDHNLMDKFEAILWLRYLSCKSLDVVVKELVQFVAESYNVV